MKKRCFVILIAILMIVLCACAMNTVDQYDNFLNDLDVFTRIQSALEQAKDGGSMTLYVKDDMKTLEQDMRMFDMTDKQIVSINDCFNEAIKLLRQNIAYMQTGDTDSAYAAYEHAKLQFDEGYLLFAKLEPDGGAVGGG